MSEPSTVDEIVTEVTKFSAAMRAAMQRHAQASNWLDRRRARKDISRLVRVERREQDQARTQHLTWTNQAVDRYRVHANAVAVRAGDPAVDHTRRARDARALAEHREALGAQFIGDRHLTRTEQGIALDGLDAATVFPEFTSGDMFARAHKVKGIQALHYRARVARETLAVERAAAERGGWYGGWAHTRTPSAGQSRYRAEMVWTDQDGGRLAESRWHPSEHGAADWMRRTIDDTAYRPGTTVHAQVEDTRATHAGGRVLFDRSGDPQFVAAGVQDREHTLRARAATGQQHVDRPVPGAGAEGDRSRGVVESLQTRLNLSIEHNGQLTDRNGRLTQQLAAVTADRDQQQQAQESYRLYLQDLIADRDRLQAELDGADTELADTVADRDRLRGERDEAVAKLAERTPAAERYGSPERQAEHAKTAREPERSALADYQPGHALAEAVARNGAGRDGFEHDGMQR
ncbi:hypothetical protein [Nocardia sp. alder85J]|uniref:hypothetical protein n=1 Tax=Nocardia sp. alder85J TaxID=2862949 RepID=UPI001CD4C0F6|nr:hypothetical protein [Nocardia sp. alder85J]MCX4094830.1 hypothetical protein [Nocardia sp. alder85J]